MRKEIKGSSHCPVNLSGVGKWKRRCPSFLMVSSDRTHGSVSELHQRWFKMEIRKNLVTKMIAKHWKKLSGRVVGVLYLCV